MRDYFIKFEPNETRIYKSNYLINLKCACYDFDGIECWSARELQKILGYAKWDNFKNVIDKAKKSCEQAGEEMQKTILPISGKWLK
jgi:hypothetical protein